jgi:hypothetical protein
MSSFRRLFLLGLGLALATLAGMVLLPHNRYIRFQDLRVEAYARLGWIYERIHFDPTPIDIAFVGTSHTLNGVDAAAVAEAVQHGGRRSEAAPPVHATNLAFPAYGRNMQWLIVRELLENRRVGTLIIEIFENESRKPHPLFVYPAEVSDVLAAPLFINLNYFHDLVRLPFRQLSLFVKSLWPEQFGLRRYFDPAHYDGETVDNTRVVQVSSRVLSPLRDRRMDPAQLDAIAAARAKRKNLHMLGRFLADLEYRLPRHYLGKMLDLAERRGVSVKFLYLPAYGQPDEPFDTSLYEGRGEVILVNDILARKDHWGDPDHLNLYGAAALSSQLGLLLARR